MLLLMVLPLVTAVWLGFNFITFKNLATPQWVGLENYIEVLSDPEFWASLRFTVLYIVVTVPLVILIGSRSKPQRWTARISFRKSGTW